MTGAADRRRRPGSGCGCTPLDVDAHGDAMQQPSDPTTGDAPDPETRGWPVLAHLSGLLSVPGPLSIWLIKRRTDAVTERHAREALNFQISILIYLLIAAFLTMILIGFVLLPIVAVFHLVMVFLAAAKTACGEPWRYPLNLRLLPA